MKRRLLVRPEAQLDITEAARWYDSRESELGTRFVNQMRDTLKQVADNPLRFPIVGHEVRRAILQRFPYSIYFINATDLVAIIAVLHQHRRPDALQARKIN
jgi:plasmid stabilization system protein ParE